MSETRTTFGFPRTECACAECVLNCQHIPGYLVPGDLSVIAAQLGYENLLPFALENLLASPGATVMANGVMFQIPTLVPARQTNGACQFLTLENRCAIHAVSPYACRAFDVHQSNTEADRRSLAGLKAIAREWAIHGLYANLWRTLFSVGLIAPPPAEGKRQIKMALLKND